MLGCEAEAWRALHCPARQGGCCTLPGLLEPLIRTTRGSQRSQPREWGAAGQKEQHPAEHRTFLGPACSSPRASSHTIVTLPCSSHTGCKGRCSKQTKVRTTREMGARDPETRSYGGHEEQMNLPLFFCPSGLLRRQLPRWLPPTSQAGWLTVCLVFLPVHLLFPSDCLGA